MRLRRAVPAGLVDAGAASVATLAVGVYAARTLSAAELGVYAVFFTAFTLSAVVPTQLVWLPVEVLVLDRPPDERLAVVRRSLLLGMAPAVALALLTSAAAVLVLPGGVSRTIVFALAASSAASSVVSPMQDHVRRMLHIASRSGAAAGVSIAQVVGAVVGIMVFSRLGVSRGWVPFGALAVANVCSMTTGLVLAARHARPAVSDAPVLEGRSLTRSGRWLLVVGLAPTVAGFAAAALVTRLAGAEMLGRAEAARIVAQPLLVVSAGLSAVLGPRSMEAAVRRDRAQAGHLARVYVLALGLCGLAYGAITGVDWSWSPLGDAIPVAYVQTGLVALTVGANVVNGLVFPYRSELIGGRRNRALAGVEVYGNALRVAFAGAASTLRANAIPLGFFVLGAARWHGYRRLRSSLYSTPPGAGADDAADLPPAPEVLPTDE